MSRFDICEAFYVYATLHHRGQGSKEYAIFGRLHRMGFRPAMFRKYLDVDAGEGLGRPAVGSDFGLTEDGQLMYDRLVSGESKVR